tara:strand:+ start:26 stop:295 length:270 start_codon:yes stop_codon:yes gene_type:complete
VDRTIPGEAAPGLEMPPHLLNKTRSDTVLLLTRRINETINIGDNITVTVLGVKENQVRLGITAPDNVKVYREEIYLRIQEEQSNPDDAA